MAKNKITSKEEAAAQISYDMRVVELTIENCKKLADEFGLTFTAPLDGIHNFGGEYYGAGTYIRPYEMVSKGQWLHSGAWC